MKYKDILVKEKMYRLDIWVERKVVVDIKSVETVLPVHQKQVLTYLQQTGSKVGPAFELQRSCTQGWYK